MERAKGDYTSLIQNIYSKAYPDHKLLSLEKLEKQGYASTTYFVSLAPPSNFTANPSTDQIPISSPNSLNSLNFTNGPTTGSTRESVDPSNLKLDLIVQIRPRTSPIPLLSFESVVRPLLGPYELVPSIRLLHPTPISTTIVPSPVSENTSTARDGSKSQFEEVWVYEMTRLPGVSLSEIIRDPGYAPGCIPDVAVGIGELLGRSRIARTKEDEGVIATVGFAQMEEQLMMAVNSTNPKIMPYEEVYQGLLEEVRVFWSESESESESESDEVRGRAVWMEVSNDDVSPTNIIVQVQTNPDTGDKITPNENQNQNHKVTVSGLVDWQFVLLKPLGYSAHALFWLIGWGIGYKYVLHPNAREIERAFWRGYVRGLEVVPDVPGSDAVPPGGEGSSGEAGGDGRSREVILTKAKAKTRREDVELIVRVGGALSACADGAWNCMFGEVGTMARYRIREEDWSASAV
ncbi:uncharacterized protein STEHIDRAFT_112439 [Stereum hirsutum FP-91666 SS1]|uniref:uncharacterized protein n=1 Tax=Stereum hirsutum (strain FP-91666) TaxID=721885 RepID=UPI000444A120|nr:uncharacterized protein STEHIDRAFT_112439 [Stereum hirsutum FP-91666 SS1]EIM84915.1 hypothetical protein STEHIDRAFT_112439 [Stereum hirsutum FP-91666 SS1]